MDPTRKRLLYILADTRSGSTLLEHLLLSSSEIVCLGEIKHFSNYKAQRKPGIGARTGWNCSCGVPLTRCEFWGTLGSQSPKPKDESNERYSADSTEVRPVQGMSARIITAFAPSAMLERFYKSSATHSERIASAEEAWKVITHGFSFCDIVLDSSKNPEQYYYLSLTNPGFRIRPILLIRDPRGVAASQRRWHKTYTGISSPSLLMRLGLCTLQALRLNNHIRHQDDAVAIDYAQLCRSQSGIAQRVLDEPTAGQRVTGLRHRQHSIAGSPNRLSDSAFQKISEDVRWRSDYPSRRFPVFHVLGSAGLWLLRRTIHRPSTRS